MSFTNRDNLISSFPIYLPFIYFYCLILLPITLSTILNSNSESGNTFLVSTLRGKGFISILNCEVNCKCPSSGWRSPLLFRVFHAFFPSYLDDHIVVFFSSLFYGELYWYTELNQLGITKNKMYFPWCIFVLCIVEFNLLKLKKSLHLHLWRLLFFFSYNYFAAFVIKILVYKMYCNVFHPF